MRWSSLEHLVRRDVVQQAGEVDPHAVREVPAVGQRQAKDGVTRFDQRLHGSGVGLCARVRLDIGEAGAEQRLDPLDGQLFDDVDELAAAVVPTSRIALRVLVRQHAALGFHGGDGGEVLAGDHLQGALLAVQLVRDLCGHLGVGLGESRVQPRPRRFGGLALGGRHRSISLGCAPAVTTSAARASVTGAHRPRPLSTVVRSASLPNFCGVEVSTGSSSSRGRRPARR